MTTAKPLPRATTRSTPKLRTGIKAGPALPGANLPKFGDVMVGGDI